MTGITVLSPLGVNRVATEKITPRLASLVFHRAPRPLFPFDDWAWRPGESRPHFAVEQSR